MLKQNYIKCKFSKQSIVAKGTNVTFRREVLLFQKVLVHLSGETNEGLSRCLFEKAGKKYRVNCTPGITSASFPLYFHPLVFTVIYCSSALTVWSQVIALSISLCTYKCLHTHGHMLSDIFHFHLLSFSLHPIFFSPAAGEISGCIGMSPLIITLVVSRIKKGVWTLEECVDA